MIAPGPSIQSLGRISLGCATFGREIDSVAAHRIMDYAVTRGISLFDTAANYGAGRSEPRSDSSRTQPDQAFDALTFDDASLWNELSEA